jgi:uncharacterized radical SAM protein YgiQ
MSQNIIRKTEESGFIPVSREEMQRRRICQFDVILVSGDAYIDHPSFGTAIVGRYIESLGLSVGIIAMPDVKKDSDFLKLGTPKYFFGVTAGNVDSMVSLFTAQKKIRSDDPYVPGGKAGLRPQRAVIAYCNIIRRLFRNVPIILGGIEASLRRITHYDYWSDTVRRPLILDAKADILVYGMGERPLKAIIDKLKSGKNFSGIRDVPGTVIGLGKKDFEAEKYNKQDCFFLPSFEDVKESRQFFSAMTSMFHEHINSRLVQKCGDGAVIINPPSEPLTQAEMDAVYELPFRYAPHPSYTEQIPAWESIKDSFVIVRGCMGGCSFCGLGVHQGKTIQSRSHESLKREVIKRAGNKEWKGIVSDLGGPTANMYGLFCRKNISARCRRRSCLAPSICPECNTRQSDFVRLINEIGSMKKVNNLYVNSGIRMDLALEWPEIIDVLAEKATGGQMSVAPEHVSPTVLRLMNKPENTGWEEFEKKFVAASRRVGRKQFLVPYLIAGHPGSTVDDAAELGTYLKKRHIKARQVQEFMPLPMTVSASMYYTGENPFTGEKIKISYKLGDTHRQKDLILWWKK